MEAQRDRYLERLIRKKWNGMVKIVTGIRRCGKSYLLMRMFRRHLLESGVPESNIIAIDLEHEDNSDLCDRKALYSYIRMRTQGIGRCYVLLDEIQNVEMFHKVLYSLMSDGDIDVYVTGSNSHMLSSDIATEFRGRGNVIHVYPLSFEEYLSAYEGDERNAFADYMRFGGLPALIGMAEEDKKAYLQNLMDTLYIRYLRERYNIKKEDELESILDVLCSSVGSLTNPGNLRKSIETSMRRGISLNTVNRYLSIIRDAFLFERVERYDINGRKRIGALYKFYMADPGLRNARLNFRSQDRSHVMENIVYLELRSRGYNVDVGIVDVRTAEGDRRYEVDFVVNMTDRRYYVQVSASTADTEVLEREVRPFRHINGAFKQILVTGDDISPSWDENGIRHIGIRQFLKDRGSLDL